VPKPEKCPECGSSDIGELDILFSSILDEEGRVNEKEYQREYEEAGGRYYCVKCGHSPIYPVKPKEETTE